MAISRDDRWLADAQGRALAGAMVYYCTQPANTSSIPPSPLATVYTDTAGDVGANPVYTDGFGHSVAYLNDAQLYTVVFVHPLFGPNPVILTDQTIPGAGGGGALTPFSGIPAGTIDGTNRAFTLTNNGTALSAAPVAGTTIAWLNFPLVEGLGFSISGTTVTYANAPQSGDTLYAQGFLA